MVRRVMRGGHTCVGYSQGPPPDILTAEGMTAAASIADFVTRLAKPRTICLMVPAAYAEGLNMLQHADTGRASHETDAETTPLRHPEHYQYDFDLAAIAQVRRRGSVVASWLLDLTAWAFVADQKLAGFAGCVSDSGEGRWTLAAANDEGVPALVLAASLFERFASRGEDDYQNRVLSAMRFGFGGHLEKK
jgi:6-phosphogluconate dehydrogenase